MKISVVLFLVVGFIDYRDIKELQVQLQVTTQRGLNVGLEFLPGVTVFDPASGDTADRQEASRTVWLDAFTLNIDRTSRNANLLVRRGELWLIDHGASLYFHHHWPAAEQKILSPFSAIREHILLPWAESLDEARKQAHETLTEAAFRELVALLPEAWLVREGQDRPPERNREAYLHFFLERLTHSSVFEEEIVRARG